MAVSIYDDESGKPLAPTLVVGHASRDDGRAVRAYIEGGRVQGVAGDGRQVPPFSCRTVGFGEWGVPQVLFARAQVVIPEADRVLLKKLCPDPGLLEGFLSFGVFFPRSYVRVGADREDEGVGVAGYGEGIHSA